MEQNQLFSFVGVKINLEDPVVIVKNIYDHKHAISDVIGETWTCCECFNFFMETTEIRECTRHCWKPCSKCSKTALKEFEFEFAHN